MKNDEFWDALVVVVIVFSMAFFLSLCAWLIYDSGEKNQDRCYNLIVGSATIEELDALGCDVDD